MPAWQAVCDKLASNKLPPIMGLVYHRLINVPLQYKIDRPCNNINE